MNVYKQYPMMSPYVGKNFHNRRKPSILLIGESHYLPYSACQHKSPKVWYSGKSKTLSEEEKGYISTAAIIEKSRTQGFKNKAHVIYKSSFSVINDYGPEYSDYTRVADDVAFYNFFLRPAFEGCSLEVKTEDIDIANEAFLKIYKELKPTAVVFISRLAHQNFEHSQSVPVPVTVTPHPGCYWWNRAAKKYGNKKGWELLADCVTATKWKKSG